jgi:hypothetical protein
MTHDLASAPAPRRHRRHRWLLAAVAPVVALAPVVVGAGPAEASSASQSDTITFTVFGGASATCRFDVYSEFTPEANFGYGTQSVVPINGTPAVHCEVDQFIEARYKDDDGDNHLVSSQTFSPSVNVTVNPVASNFRARHVAIFERCTGASCSLELTTAPK